MDNNNIFWTQNPAVLYQNEAYLEFVPKPEMTRISQLNAASRFVIYYLILVIILKKSEQWIHLGIVVLLFIIVLFYSFNKDDSAKQQELLREKGLVSENFASIEKNDEDKDNTNDFQIESGYYDSNGKLHIGKYYGSHDKSRTKANKINYSLEDFDNYKKASCRMPTIDNPYMNPLQTDFGVENPPSPCNADDENITAKISDAFNHNLFRDVSDVFERENSQRQFYTVPQMNPPDTHAFAMWLYGDQDICKQDQSKCLKYTDLRYNGGTIGDYSF